MRKTKKQRFRASILAFLLIASMVLGMVPGSAGQVYAKESTSSPSEEEPGLIDKAVDFFQNTGDKIASYFGAGGEAQPAAAFDETSVVDAETSQGWQTLVKKTTQNIGRIWTDKSVYNSNVTLPGIGDGASIPITKPKESDFMVGLSALSSTSNTSVTTSTPLDIVLVLDVSGSMSDKLGTTYEYTAAYTIDTGEGTTYYALDKAGQYVKVKKITRWDTSGWPPQRVFDYWELNGVKVEPKTDSNDNDPNHIQFYTYGRRTKMDALETAVNGFIDATAEQNALIADPAKQHQISIVKYAGNIKNSVGNDTYYEGGYEWNHSQIVSDLTNNTTSLKNAVDNLRAVGGTAADNGMQLANTVLTAEGHGARANAQKIVVMFTDGEPTEGNDQSFNSAVATRAIQNAKTLKDARALVYTIGVLNGADPDANINTDTEDNINAYLHSVSSNYPKAKGYEGGRNGAGWIMDDRAANSNYYKAATNSEELNNIFQEISEEINTGTGYPTQTEDGFANKSGYVTFHDQLGDYMQVDSFNTLVLEDIRFDEVEKTEADGVITYTYKGSAGENKNVSYIVIKVTPGTGSTGDTVDVKIPAALLPLRHFKVDVSGNRMTVEDKYPLRLFYNVSLKEDAKKALANPDQEMKNYIAKNAADGNVYFYSNKFTGSKQGPTEGQTLGDTTATFKPATGNSFYYFTENTRLWLDEQMSQPATSYSAEQGHDTYYYAKTYYKLVEGKPEEVTEAVSFRPHPQDEVQDWVGTTTDGQLYIKAGAPRLTRIYDLTASKGKDAVPGTATEVITPNWDNKQAQRNIEVSLGNNGRLAVELPGTLEISKTVTSEVDAPEKDFNFKLTLKNAGGEALTGEFDAQKFDAQGVASGDPIKVQNDGTVTLKDGESVKIYGLSNGDTYSIEETQIPKGFTAKENPIEGTIKGNETVTAAFVNTYKAAPVIVDTSDTEGNIRLRKVLRGRDWHEGENFAFTMTPQSGAPIPAENQEAGITIDDAGNVHAVVTAPENGAKDGEEVFFGFGEITYSTAGTYVYTVTEDVPDSKAGGMTYSENVATITVTVTDPGTGNLSAAVTVSGSESGSRFYNDYAASLAHNAAGGIVTTKTLTGHDMEAKQFTFQVEALAGKETTAEENAKRIGIQDGTTGTYRNDKAAADGDKITMKTEDGHDIKFTTKDIGKTFKYRFSEMGADGQFGTGGSKDGYTYDTESYTVELSVTDDGDGTLTLHTKVTNKDGQVTEETSTEEDPKETRLDFTNGYAADGTLNGAANLAGTKKMDGPWKATGKDLSGFQFTITGGDEATNTAIIAGTVVLPTEKTVTSDATGKFNFDDITFNKKGTYKFTVSEVVPAEEDKILGVTYNAAPVTITVNVTDNDNGTLTATLAENSPKLTFTNTYATTRDATFTPSVVKKVEGLDAQENFTFKLSAADEATEQAIDNDTITGIGTRADKYSSEKTTTGVITKDNPQTVNFDELTFKKAGTYKFTVKEINENTPTGWTYDGHTYKITINVTDVDSVLKAQMGITDPNTNSQIFTNSFKATTTYGEEGGLNVTKTLNGRTLKEDMFNFTITGKATDSVTAEEANAKLENTDKNFKNTAPGEDGVAVMSKLGAVQFDETDIGKTYQYTVQEIAGTDTKYTYDNVSATVAIQVLENDGELYTVTTVTKGKDVQEYSSINESKTAVVPFVNSYTPDIVTVEPGTFGGEVTKVLKGNRDTALEADEFNFQMTITPADDTSNMEGVVLPEGAVDGTVTAANAAKGLVSFGNIQFKAAGNYHVAISEVIPEPADPNMTYDKHTFSYDIAVTYNAAEGTLSAAVVEGSIKGSETFTNIYEADDAKDVANTKEPTTSVNGKIVGVGDQLTYTIDWVNNAVDETGAPAKAEVTITDVVPAGTKYVSADDKGAYDQDTNTITWNLGEQEAGASGTVSFVVKVLDSAGGTEVTNKAEITVGNNDPKQTNNVTTNVPGKDSVVEEGGELQVGKVLTYTISYKNPEEEASTVTIKDIIPKGLDYVEGSASNGATYNEEDRTLTWTIADVQPGTEGTVTFDAKVNESAETVIDNKATIQIGDNAPTYDTNTDQNEIPKDGNLSISKTIALTKGQGTKINKEQTFTFTVEFKDAKGSALTNEYAYTVTDGDQKIAEGKIANAGPIFLKHGQKATITGLPAGVQYKVTETEAAGYTADALVKEGTVSAKKTANADFTNTYSVTGSLIGADSLKVTKNFTGREGNQWLESDAFTFTLTAADDEATKAAIKAGLITLPDPAKITINSNTEGKQAAFGNITFNIAGTFKFNVTEQKGGIAGVTDDAKPVREIVVNVVDNKDGTLKATIAKGSDNLTFTNTYGAGSGKEDIAAKIPATKKLTGRDMNADEFAFEVVTRAVEGAEEFTETVVATGRNLAGADGEAARVTFAGSDANGAKALNYTTKSLNKAVEAGYAVKEGNVWTVNYTAREKTDRLPEGVIPVAEKTEFNFTIVVTDKTDGTLTAEVQTPEGGIAFENTYATGGTDVNTDPTEATAYFNKKLTGRDWLSTDAFTFTITPKDGAPAPEDAAADGTKTVTVTSDSAKADALVPFGFGTIRFTDAHMEGATPNDDGTVSKTFTYDVTEVIPEDGAKIPGITYDGHTATLAITVTDNLQGELSATAVITTENGTFTNNYRSNLNYNAVGGLRISKVLNGRDMQKDQFTFRLTPKATEGSTTAKEAAQKLGFDEVKAYEFKNEAAAMGKATYMNVLSGKEVVFTQADAGKTYTYEIVEVKGQNEAYTYDEAVNIVTITVVDNNNGTLTVTTTVKKNGEVVDTKVVSTGDAEAAPATAPFVNVYNDVPESLGGEGSVAINATKSLTNRPMADREFTFHVTDKNEAQVATGNNDASGKITFTPIEYTTDKLNEDAEKGTATKSYDVEKDAYTYTYQYKVEEDLSNVDEGVTGIVTAFSIQVVVTDDGNGKLTIAVVYPDGKDPLPFENAYGTSAKAAIHVNGQKVLNVESGNNAPDITGKYIFTLSGSDGAPMPEKATANNDAAGNVDFGKITYTMQNVFGDKGVTAEAEGTEEALTEVMPVSDTRTKTFTYTVTESGTVEGVTNDAESVKTFNVIVTDNGDGTIKVDKDYTGFEFGFTNTYHVEPVDFDINDAEAGITVKKELTGRAMNAGEFVFELISDKDKSVREAVNDTDGNVKFETMNFTAPGEYIYTLRERNTKLGGVDYDTTEYQVVVTVTDNGDGTMSAEAKLADEGKDVVFKNQYEAAPTSVMFGASKIYKGADLKDGQFTFVVKDADGNVVSEAKNNKDGMVTFDTIEFNEEGTYTFTISEKNDKQKNVTYDKAVYEVTVTVTDNGEGSLIAEVAYADGKAPVFTNKYTKPEEPKGPTAVKTGDETPVIPFIILMVATLAIIVTITFIFFRRKRR